MPHGIPQDIYQIAKRRSDDEGSELDENFDLGDELTILTRKDNWSECFEKIFIGKEFINQNELQLAIQYLKRVRDPASHGKERLIESKDLNKCELYLNDFNEIFLREKISLDNESE